MADSKLTSVGKPKIGGAIFRAPVGSVLPSDAVTALDGAFKCLGYCGEDGLKNEVETEGEEIKAWGGDVVLTTSASKKDTFSFKLIEVLNEDVLKTVHGDENVSGTLSDGITVKVNNAPQKASSWVAELVLNNAVKRIVIPSAAITKVGEIVYKDDEEIGYEVTILATADSHGNTHYEYIKKGG